MKKLIISLLFLLFWIGVFIYTNYPEIGFLCMIPWGGYSGIYWYALINNKK